MDPRPYHYQYRRPRLSNPTYQSNSLYQSIYQFGTYSMFQPNMDKVQNNNSQLMQSYFNGKQAQYRQELDRNQQKREKLRQQIRNIDPYYENLGSIPRGQNNIPDNKSQMYNKNNYPNGHKYARNIQMGDDIGNIQSFTPPKHHKLDHNSNQNNKYMSSSREMTNQRPNPSSEYQKQYKRSYSQDAKKTSQLQKAGQQQNYLSNYGSNILKSFVRRQDQDYIYQRQQKPYNIVNCYPKEVLGTHRNHPKYTLQHRLIESGQYLPNGNIYNPEY